MKRFLAQILTVAMLFSVIAAVPVFASNGLEVIIDHDDPAANPPITKNNAGMRQT